MNVDFECGGVKTVIQLVKLTGNTCR